MDEKKDGCTIPKKHSVVVEQNAAGGQPVTRIENNIESTEAVLDDGGCGGLNEELPKFVSQGCQTERSMMAAAATASVASNHLGTNTTEGPNVNNKEGNSQTSFDKN